jgi:hypothetical protein
MGVRVWVGKTCGREPFATFLLLLYQSLDRFRF